MAENGESIRGSIVTDCGGPNDGGRSQTAFRTLFGELPAFVSAQSGLPIEVGLNTIDQLDVGQRLIPQGQDIPPQVILANVNWRSDKHRAQYDHATSNGVPVAR